MALRDIQSQQTERQKEQFLDALRVTGHVTTAADQLHINRGTFYRWLELDNNFREQYLASKHLADEVLADRLEVEAIKRAEGKSDLLMMFLLKGLRPGKFRESNPGVQITGPVQINVRYGDDQQVKVLELSGSQEAQTDD